MSKWKTVQVNFNPDELEVIQEAAKRAGMDVEVYIKNAALINGREAPSKRTGHELVWIYREAASRGHVWTEKELREKQLPLYWSEAWVRQRLAEGCTVSQIAVLSHSPKTTVTNHLSTHFNIDSGKRHLSETDIQTIRERFQSGESRRKIAEDLGVSNATIGKHLKGLPTEYERLEREARRLLGQTLHDRTPVSSCVDRESNWTDRLFAERIQLIETWPTSTAVIADRVFSGNRSVAKDWTQKMVKGGRLVRLTRGWFDLSGAVKPDGRTKDVKSAQPL